MANEAQAGRARRVRLFWITAVAVAVAAVAWALIPGPVEADFVTIGRGVVNVDLVDEGRTRMHDVYVISAPVSGRVLRVDVEPGDAVIAGAVVARMTSAAAGFLDPRTDSQARAAINAAEAQLRAADTELKLADIENTRAQNLAAQQLIAATAVDAAQARLDSAHAAQDAARAEVVRARAALQPASRTDPGAVSVVSPVAGKVLRVPQKSEAVLPVGAPLVEVGDPSLIEVVAQFLSQDAVRMRAGQSAQVENWGGSPLKAVVERVEPVAHTKISALGVEEQRTNVILHFADPQAASALGHDYRVDARVTVAEYPDAVRAPLGALFRRGEQWSAYKVVEGRARLIDVSVGEADSTWRVVTQGLNEGDTVIVFPGATIADGMRVKARAVVAPPPPAAVL
ncbi:MAG: efflux RND transporter periplasmic adaptor subunit [Nevskiaceae bacterium]|jgi:HlyD family secretion protein|nr:efflux RND transporter periplasmic adaptor subunit [Nevskiaceae bacterium]